MGKIILCVLLYGYLYAQEKGTNLEIQAMKKACERNNSTACYELGILYENGMGVEQNSTKVINYYSKACHGKLEKACHALKRFHAE